MALATQGAGPSAGVSYYKRLIALFPSSLAFSFKLDDLSGITAVESIASANGTHHNVAGVLSGVSLNQEGFQGAKSTLYDGTNGYTVITSAALKSLIDTQEFTIMGIAKATATTWSVGDTYGHWFHCKVNASNYFTLGRFGLAGQLCQFDTKMGGTQKIIIYNSAGLDTDFFHWAYTVSVSGDLVRAYINGVPVSAGLSGLGTWAAGTMVSYLSTELISPIVNRWNGYQQLISFFNKALSASEVAALTSGFF